MSGKGKVNIIKRTVKTNIKKQEKTEIKPLKFIEVCSGAGGLSTGFCNMGFTPVLLNDFDKTCCKTLEKNHPQDKVILDSFTDIDFANYTKYNIDLMMGGVPSYYNV